MSFENCEITFSDRSIPVFYAGEEVKGTIKMILVSTKKITDLRMIVSGLGKCNFTQSAPKYGSNRKDCIKRFYGEEIFLSTNNSLLVDLSTNNDQYVLDAGEHLYSFSFMLDNYLPTSYQGSNGKIRYKIILELERPFALNKVFCLYFTVISYVDLNYTPYLNTPLKKMMSENMACIFLNKGWIKIVSELSKTGFVSGETIIITFGISNESKVSIQDSRFSLVKMIQYTGKSPYTNIIIKEETVSVHSTGKIVKKHKTFKKIRLEIPPLPPSTLYNPRCIINIQYKIKIKIYISGMHSNMKMEIPIVIGTVPLKPPSEYPETILPPLLPAVNEENFPSSPSRFPNIKKPEESDSKENVSFAINSGDDVKGKTKNRKYMATYLTHEINKEDEELY